MVNHSGDCFSHLCKYIENGRGIFFFGAGASCESGLYAAWTLVDNTISTLGSFCSEVCNSEVLAVREEVFNGTRAIDWPRLEKVMQLLIRSVGPMSIKLLDIYDLAPPREAHIFVVQAAETFGCNDFFTTNFDTCIEKAGEYFPRIKILEIVTESEFKSAPTGINCLCNFLLHGTLPKRLEGHEDLIIATIDGILRALPSHKWQQLVGRTSGRAVVFVGYSASDFDLRPRLIELTPNDIFWVDDKSLPGYARMILGDQRTGNFIQMRSKDFFVKLRAKLGIPAPEIVGSLQPVPDVLLKDYIGCWAKSLDSNNVELFFVDLFTFLGESPRAHRILDVLQAQSENDKQQRLRMKLRRAELFSREFLFPDLRKLLKEIDLDDSGNDVETRVAIARYYQLAGDPASATQIAEDAGAIASNSEDKARCRRFLGQLNIRENCTEESTKLLKESASLFFAAGKMEERVLALNHLAVSYQRRGYLDKAEGILEEVVSLAKEIGDAYQCARAENNYGEVCRFRGLLKEAREHYDEASRLAKLVGGDDVHMIVLSNYGLTYLKDGNYQKAKSYFEQAIDAFSSKKGLLEDLGNAYLNLGFVLIEVGEPKQALEKLEEASRIFGTIHAGARSLLVDIYRVHAYLVAGRIDEAEKLCSEVLEDDIDNSVLNIQVYYARARLQVHQAYRLLGAATDLAEAMGALEDAELAAQVRAKLKQVIEKFPTM